MYGSLIRTLLVVGVIVVAIAAIFVFSKVVEDIVANAKKIKKDDYDKYKNKHCVYMLKRKMDNVIFYVGITKNLKARMAAHENDKRKPAFNPYLVAECKTDGSSRVLEQVLINSLALVELTIQGSNKIRSIAKTFNNRIKYKDVIADITDIYFNQIENETYLAMGM